MVKVTLVDGRRIFGLVCAVQEAEVKAKVVGQKAPEALKSSARVHELKEITTNKKKTEN